MMKIRIAFSKSIVGIVLSENQYTGMRKNENGKRSNCIVER